MKTRLVMHNGASTRLPHRDYTHGTYFITIVTQGRAQMLSQIIDGRVRLTKAGKVVEDEWRATAERRHSVTLDRFVIMPEHFQAIVRLRPKRSAISRDGAKTLSPDSLGAIVGRFKSACVRRIRRDCIPDFAWQRRFHDRVIRSRGDLERTRRYIQDNPKEWASAHSEIPPSASHP
jgi:putative transposase